MVQQHIGRAGGVGAGIVAHHAVEAVDRLDRPALEPAVQPVPGRLGEQGQQVALTDHVELGEPLAQAGALQQLRNGLGQAALHQVGRGLQHQLAHHVGNGFQPVVVGVQSVSVGLAEPRHLGLGVALAGHQVVAVQGQEIGHLALHHLQPVAMQLQVGDDLGIEQGDGVAGHRVAEPRMELLGDRGPAHHVAALQHRDLQPGLGQVGGADQAVMAPAHDDDVTVHLRGHQAGSLARCGAGRGARASGIWAVRRSAKARRQTSEGPRGPLS